MMHSTYSRNIIARIIDSAFGLDNIYRFQAKKTVSLGTVLVATVARDRLPWCKAEVINENNYPWIRRGPRDKDGLPDHLELQKESKAEFIGISASMSNTAPRAVKIIGDYRSMPPELQPKAIIVGGWHAGDRPEDFLNAGADVVVHGEAEVIIDSLLHALKEDLPLDNIPGISYKKDGRIQRNGPDFLFVPQDEMDYLPDPDFGLVRFARIKIYPIGRTRGCSGKCRFCRVRSCPRSISPQRFVEQIKVLYSKGAKRFFVVDDRSEEDLEGFAEWLRGVAEFKRQRNITNISFTTQNRLSLASHPDMLMLMREAGVDAVAIGYESPIKQELAAMRKPLNPEKIVAWSRVWQKFGFYVHMMLIFGYPTPPGAEPLAMSLKERERIYDDFIEKIGPDTLQVLLYTPIPGTPDWDFLESQNRIYGFEWDLYDGTRLLFEPDQGIDPVELQGSAIRLMRKFYSFPFIWRSRWMSVIAHPFRIGLVTVSMPFLWIVSLPFQRWSARAAWSLPCCLFRNTRRKFQGHLIIMDWMYKFKKSGFETRLRNLVKTPCAVNV